MSVNLLYLEGTLKRIADDSGAICFEGNEFSTMAQAHVNGKGFLLIRASYCYTMHDHV